MTKPKISLLPHRVYLASQSPRRYELLTQLGVEVEVIAAAIDETPLAQELPERYVERMALQKNLAAQKQAFVAALPIISADTVVVHQGEVLGKPKDAADAQAMLQRLSGQTHEVLTAVCVFQHQKRRHALCRSQVQFRSIDVDEIAAYLASGEPFDKAGAYAIQGLGGLFVRHLSGSFSGVMGLPIFETAQLLQATVPD